ncbi:MAG: hypothetical protein SGPRY_008099, partial [Prymnesium sp.]
ELGGARVVTIKSRARGGLGRAEGGPETEYGPLDAVANPEAHPWQADCCAASGEWEERSGEQRKLWWAAGLLGHSYPLHSWQCKHCFARDVGSSHRSLSCERAAPSVLAPMAQVEEPASPQESSSPLKCDKCDGRHPTSACPWFKKAREKHKDADPATAKKQARALGVLGMASGPPEILPSSSVRVVRQPGDGSCLFHSLCYGLKDGSTASGLRRQ